MPAFDTDVWGKRSKINPVKKRWLSWSTQENIKFCSHFNNAWLPLQLSKKSRIRKKTKKSPKLLGELYTTNRKQFQAKVRKQKLSMRINFLVQPSFFKTLLLFPFLAHNQLFDLEKRGNLRHLGEKIVDTTSKQNITPLFNISLTKAR